LTAVACLFPLGKTTSSDNYLMWVCLFFLISKLKCVIPSALWIHVFIAFFPSLWHLVFYLKTSFSEFVILLFSYYMILQHAIEWLIGLPC